jgi:hypothetical protein
MELLFLSLLFVTLGHINHRRKNRSEEAPKPAWEFPPYVKGNLEEALFLASLHDRLDALSEATSQ